MREIKFRAWDRQRKRMINDLVPFQESRMPSNWHSFYDVMQFTGLHDKNGKEIYEGDIVRLKRHEGKFTDTVVEWYPPCAGFFFRFISDPSSFECPDETHESHQEIIGNVHENSNLLGD